MVTVNIKATSADQKELAAMRAGQEMKATISAVRSAQPDFSKRVGGIPASMDRKIQSPREQLSRSHEGSGGSRNAAICVQRDRQPARVLAVWGHRPPYETPDRTFQR